MNLNNITKNRGIVVALMLMMNLLFIPTVGQAASLSSLSDTMTRLKTAVTSNHVVKFTTPTGADQSSDTITLAFTSFTGTVTASDVTLTHGPSTGLETSETVNAAAGSNIWGASWSSPTLTLTAPTNATTGEITANDKVIVSINNNKLTNPAAGTYIVTLAGGFGDTGKVAVVVVSDDQVQVSANIDPSLTFSLSANATGFGSLSTAGVATASPSIDLTVATNAAAGYTLSVKDQGNGSSAGLYNGTNLIASGSASLVGGTEGYGIQATSASATISGPYNVVGNNVGALSTSAANLATFNSSTTSSHTITVSHKAAISASTKPGTYADTITYIATGNF